MIAFSFCKYDSPLNLGNLRRFWWKIRQGTIKSNYYSFNSGPANSKNFKGFCSGLWLILGTWITLELLPKWVPESCFFRIPAPAFFDFLRFRGPIQTPAKSISFNTSYFRMWHEFVNILSTKSNDSPSHLRPPGAQNLHIMKPSSLKLHLISPIRSRNSFDINVVTFYTRQQIPRKSLITKDYLYAESCLQTDSIIKSKQACQYARLEIVSCRQTARKIYTRFDAVTKITNEINPRKRLISRIKSDEWDIYGKKKKKREN